MLNTEDNNNKLITASENGHLEVVKLLLEKGVNGTTILSRASYFGRLELVKLLLEKNANNSVKDNRSTAPMTTASSSNHSELSKLLLKKYSSLEEIIDIKLRI